MSDYPNGDGEDADDLAEPLWFKLLFWSILSIIAAVSGALASHWMVARP